MIEKAKRTEAALMTACGEAPLNTPKDSMVSIQWRDIVVNTTAGRRLLRGITGIAHPKEVVALMGASGAGKTTLLNTLLQRNLRGLNVKGTVLVNGRNIGQAVTTVSAYVQQEDLFVGTLTVREHLMLQARMRLPSKCKEEDRIARVNEVLRDMSLEGAQSSRIGIPGVLKGISGGERKRLAFASEILNNPPILFCDEPTTGLDSHMAMLIVRRLESLAATQGKTIICTIHQPSSETFELFDKVVFLAQGRVVFQGSPSESVIFFSKCGYTMPLHTNPADYYIDTLAINPDKRDECKKRCNEISDKFALSQYNYRMQEQMSIASYPREMYPHNGPNFLILLSSLIVRYLKDNMRNPAMLRAKFIQKVFMGIFLGLLYLNTPLNQDGLMSIQGVLFYYCSELTYSTIFGIQACMPGDFPMLIREYHDGVYPVSAYYLGKIFSYLPIFTLDGMVMITISYFMIGLVPEPINFVKTLITCMLVEWNVASLGIAICSISPSYAFAISVSGPILTVLSLTGGLFINTTEMPQWSKWIQYVSWFRYGFESLIINEFNDESRDNITCLGNAGTVMPNCVSNGAGVLEELHFAPENFYWNWMMLVLSTLAIFCFGYIGLVFRVKRLR